MGSSKDMEPLSQFLATSGYHVLSFDLPFHAGSIGVQPETPRKAAIAILSALSRLTSRRNTEKNTSANSRLHDFVDVSISIIGYSLGGRLALEICSLLSSTPHTSLHISINALVLISCAPPVDESSFPTIAECQKVSEHNADSLLQNSSPEDFQHWLMNDWYGAPMWGSISSSPSFHELITSRINSYSASSQQPEAWANASVRLGRAFMSNFPPEMDVDVPLLYICGDIDSKYKKFIPDFRRLFQKLDECIVPGVGHNVLFQAKDLTMKAISDFLSSSTCIINSDDHFPFLLSNVSLKSYSLEMHSTMFVNQYSISGRDGFLVAVTANQGFTGIGDVCPLPGLHKTSIEACKLEIEKLSNDLMQQGGQRGTKLCAHCFDLQTLSELTNHLSPVTRNGVECAILHALSQMLGVKLQNVLLNLLVQELMFPDESNGGDEFDRKIPDLDEIIEDVIHINGVFPRKPMSHLEKTLPNNSILFNFSDTLRNSPFQTLKLKVGACKRVQDDAHIAIIAAQACKAEGKTLRLDANRAWDIPTYKSFLNELIAAGDCISSIDYIEEPVQNINQLRYIMLRKDSIDDNTNVLKIALDETLDEYSSAKEQRKDIEELVHHCAALVVKPAVLGSLSQLVLLIRLVSKAMVKCNLVLSSVFESGVGMAWNTILASVCNHLTVSDESGLIPSPKIFHGLGTYSHLSTDAVDPSFASSCIGHDAKTISLQKSLCLLQNAVDSYSTEAVKTV